MWCTIGPRHTTASPAGTRKPMLMTGMPPASKVCNFPSTIVACPDRPNRCGMLGPNKSASNRPTCGTGVLEGDGQRRSDRALADAAFAGAHGDHALGADADLADRLDGSTVLDNLHRNVGGAG